MKFGKDRPAGSRFSEPCCHILCQFIQYGGQIRITAAIDYRKTTGEPFEDTAACSVGNSNGVIVLRNKAVHSNFTQFRSRQVRVELQLLENLFEFDSANLKLSRRIVYNSNFIFARYHISGEILEGIADFNHIGQAGKKDHHVEHRSAQSGFDGITELRLAHYGAAGVIRRNIKRFDFAGHLQDVGIDDAAAMCKHAENISLCWKFKTGLDEVVEGLRVPEVLFSHIRQHRRIDGPDPVILFNKKKLRAIPTFSIDLRCIHPPVHER